MKIIIFGATGRTGQKLVEQALEQGHEITVFVRNPDKLKHPPANLHIVEGDVLDYSAVEKSIKGQDAVLCALGINKIMDKSQLRAKGTKNISLAMNINNVSRIICQSGFGCGDSRSALPFIYRFMVVPIMLGRVFADHAIQEKELMATGLDWTIVRPATLTDDKLTGSYFHGIVPIDRSLTTKISFADVADFMLKQLGSNKYLHKAPVLAYTK